MGGYINRCASRTSARKIMNEALADLISGDDERAERSIPSLVQLGSQILPSLLELARSEDSELRWWAVRALAASPLTRTADFLPLLNDAVPEVRAATALALCHHPHESAIAPLIFALADEDLLTAGLAGNALVKIGSPAVPALIQAVNDAPSGTRLTALRTLSAIGDSRAIPIFMKCLGEESALLQYWAEQGLERLGLDMVYIQP